MPKYYIEDREKYMFRDVESQRENLYYILTEIGVNEDFLWRHAAWIDEASKMEERKRRKLIQEKINQIESKGGKTNYFDMYEMYGRVNNLWSMIAQTQNLPESFIEKHYDKFKNYWRSICEYQKLSEDFMRRNSEKLDWWAVAHFQKYSEDFYFEFFDEINGSVRYKDLLNKEHLRPERLKNEGLILLLKIRGEL